MTAFEEIPLFDLDPRTHARWGDPDTSHAAARALSPRQTMMRRLLTAFMVEPLTADEAIWRCGYTAEAGAWKRISDLTLAGFLEDTGQRRPGRSGRDQMVRRITAEGRRAL